MFRTLRSLTRGRPASLGTYKQVEFWLLLSSSVISAKTVTVTVSPRRRWVNTYLFLHTVFLILLSFHFLQNSISLVINYNETQLLQIQKHINAGIKLSVLTNMIIWSIWIYIGSWTAERKEWQELLQFVHLIINVYNLNTFNYNLLLFLRLERHGLPVQWH